MPVTVKDMMAAANAVVPRVDAVKARELIEHGALLLDIRGTAEVQKTGRAKGGGAYTPWNARIPGR